MKLIAQNKCHAGYWQRYQHESTSCHCPMTFSIFLPMDISQYTSPKDYPRERKFTTLIWLSGLTCNDQNFVQKAHVEASAIQHGCIVVVPDTSPRDCQIEGEDDSWDFGAGAGFYLDATRAPWRQHYRMQQYIVEELLTLVSENFPVNINEVGIFGHSMGGHGALTLALKYPEKFRSVSAFAPICAPLQCEWGTKALSGYLENDSEYPQYDTCELIASGYRFPHALIDQGSDDEFLESQLKPELLLKRCQEAELSVTYHLRSGYDHSYFFISTFIDDHIEYHAKKLRGIET